MPTPADHYREAERLLDAAERLSDNLRETIDGGAFISAEQAEAVMRVVDRTVAHAHVHAVLAAVSVDTYREATDG